MMNKSSYLLVFAALIVGIAFNSFFIVDEKEKAIVFQFGEAVRTDIDVGFSLNCLLFRKLRSSEEEYKHLMRPLIEF